MSPLHLSLLVLSCVCGHHILQLSDQTSPLSLSSATTVSIPQSPCAGVLIESTVAGWFRTDPGKRTLLVSITAGETSLWIEKAAAGTVELTAWNRHQQVRLEVTGTGTGNWEYVALAQAEGGRTMEMCVKGERGKGQCAKGGEGIAGLDLSQGEVRLGGGEESSTLEVFDVTVLSVALSASEIESLSASSGCGADPTLCISPTSLAEQTSLVASCAVNGLTQKKGYSDADLYKNSNWDFGINMFFYDSYTYSPNFSTVKVVFELNDIIGDPDMDVYLYHYFAEDEFLGSSKNIGPDSITFDWNTPRFKDGIGHLDTFKVSITGKSWFTFYTIEFYYYSTSWLRESTGKEIYSLQTTKEQPVGGWLGGWIVLITMIAGTVAVVVIVSRKRHGKIESQTRLQVRLLSQIDY